MATLRKCGWTTYDHLGGIVLCSLLWDVLALPWLGGAAVMVGFGLNMGGEWASQGLIVALVLAVEFVLLAPPTVVFFVAGFSWSRQRDIEMRELVRSVGQYFVRIQLMGLMVMATTLLLLVNVFFYQQMGGWFGLVLSGTMIWLLVALALLCLYLFPVLVAQNGGIKQTLGRSAFLALDNIGPSLGWLLVVLLVLALGVATGIGIFCGFLAALALWLSIAMHQMEAKYGGEEVAAEPPRRWRDILRPWEN